MKKFFEKNGLILIICLVFVAIFAVGVIYSNYVSEERLSDITADENRYFEKIGLLDLTYNFDPETLGEKTYIATFTYEDVSYKAYLDHTFTFVEMIEGDALDLVIMSGVKHHAEQEKLIQNIAYLVSYSESTKTLVLEAYGFADVIQCEVVLNDAFDGIESYTITSSETYTSEYNPGYTGGAVPEVENQMMDQYMSMSGAVDIDAIAGASEGTGNAMQELITLMNQFMDSLEGGN